MNSYFTKHLDENGKAVHILKMIFVKHISNLPDQVNNNIRTYVALVRDHYDQ